jgi:hypothetical protein
MMAALMVMRLEMMWAHNLDFWMDQGKEKLMGQAMEWMMDKLRVQWMALLLECQMALVKDPMMAQSLADLRGNCWEHLMDWNLGLMRACYLEPLMALMTETGLDAAKG